MYHIFEKKVHEPSLHTVDFWYHGIAQKFFKTFDTSFDTKMMVKSGAIKNYQKGWLGVAS